MKQLARLNTANVYPNPSDQYVTISYSLLGAQAGTYISVFDGLGREKEKRIIGEVYEGQELFDTRKMPNGIYFYQILQKGKKVHDGKFVVTH